VENCQMPSHRLNRRILRLVVILAGTVLATTSCGGDDGGSAATTPSPATSAATGDAATPSPATSAATGDAATGTVINVDEQDFTIELSTMELTPGTYTFVTTNNGQTTHALKIDGQGLEEETADLAPGDTAELTVTLEAGEYEIYCPVGNHRDMGMKLDITVE
jgi:uncharacterized cupredoxin-like copper-binding protein